MKNFLYIAKVIFQYKLKKILNVILPKTTVSTVQKKSHPKTISFLAA